MLHLEKIWNKFSKSLNFESAGQKQLPRFWFGKSLEEKVAML
jgi:hypothetical protein